MSHLAEIIGGMPARIDATSLAARLPPSSPGNDADTEARPGHGAASPLSGAGVVLEDGVRRPVRGERLVLTGIDLRYVLTVLLLEEGAARTVNWLAAAIGAGGFALRGRPSKVVSDALRWEVGRGRVRRVGRGGYAPSSIPRQTKSRMVRRVDVLRRFTQTAGWDELATDLDSAV